MNLTELLAWASGPGAGVIASWLLEMIPAFKNWKPSSDNPFNPKAAVSGIVMLVVGLGAYAVATNVPESNIKTADPYVAAAFPLLVFLFAQFTHWLMSRKPAVVITSPPVKVTTETKEEGTKTTTDIGAQAAPPVDETPAPKVSDDTQKLPPVTEQPSAKVESGALG